MAARLTRATGFCFVRECEDEIRVRIDLRFRGSVRAEASGLRMVSVHGGLPGQSRRPCLEHEKGIRWMPWHQEAMKDVARCEKPWGAASRL